MVFEQFLQPHLWSYKGFICKARTAVFNTSRIRSPPKWWQKTDKSIHPLLEYFFTSQYIRYQALTFASNLAKFLIKKKLLNLCKYLVKFQLGQTVRISDGIKQPHGPNGVQRLLLPKIQSHSQRQPKAIGLQVERKRQCEILFPSVFGLQM